MATNHGNQFEALHFLLIALKKPGCPSVYKTLNRSNIYEWFTNTRELKSNYSYVAKLGLHLFILEEYLELKDAFEGGWTTTNNLHYIAHSSWDDPILSSTCDS